MIRVIGGLVNCRRSLTGSLFVIELLFVTSLAAASQKDIKLLDIEGRTFDPLAPSTTKAAVFVFVRDDCPVSNRYIPEVQRLTREFRPKGIDFFFVYPDPASTVEQIRQHSKEYDYDARALRDPEHSFVSYTGVKVTPEVVVLAEGKIVYRGRIDNRYVAFGKVRPSATVHDLADTLDVLSKGEKVEPRTTSATGCFISDLKRDPKR